MAVCAHDVGLSRVSGGADARRVRFVRYRELPRLAGGERIPTLAEALERLRGRFVNVEVKADDSPSITSLVKSVAMVVAGDAGRSEVLLSSFDPRVVLGLAAVLPRTPRGMLVSERTAALATALPVALRRAVVAAHVQESLLTPVRLATLRRAGLRIVAWTVNEPSRAQALVDGGASILITDRPGEIASAFAARRAMS